VTCKLLLRVLSSLESVKTTQKLQMTMLQSLLQRDGRTVPESAEPPDGMSFPIQNEEDLNSIEERLADAVTKKALVCLLHSHVLCKIVGFVSILVQLYCCVYYCFSYFNI